VLALVKRELSKTPQRPKGDGQGVDGRAGSAMKEEAEAKK
jgi:hypothetical protein